MDNVEHNIKRINNDTNRQLHSQPNRGNIHHSTVNTQDSNTADSFQGISIGNRNVFVAPSSDELLSQTQDQSNVVNSYWSGYHQPSQHRQHVTRTGLDHQMPIPSPTPAPAEPTRVATPTPKPLNQNQVHAQAHPWRIKTPQSKNTKQKAKYSSEASTAAPASSSGRSIAKGHTSSHLNQHHQHPQSGAVDAAKEIRQQRRSSTKDAASGSFPHSTSRRSKEPPPPPPPPPVKDTATERPIPNVGSVAQAPIKNQQSSSNASGQLGPRPMAALIVDRDTVMPDLYHILVNSVTIPSVSRFPQSAPQTSSPTTGLRGGGVLMGMDHLNLTLASPAISNFTVLNADHADPDQHQSSFQKDPSANSFLDQTTPVGFVITNKSVIQYLVHVYFECFHVHWMIVDKEKFLSQLKDPAAPPDPLLLVAICAAGAKYSDHEGLCAEPGNLPTIGEQFLTHARILLQDRFDMPSMSTLQALLILYWCQVQTGRASLRFMYVGMAIRMAQEMGLNRHVDPKRLKDMDEREVQIRKTIWWSCYQADRWTSAALGKPMVISDVDCLVDYPSSLMENERYHIQSFCRMTDLAKILGKIILNLYTSTNAATCSSAVFSHLDQSLSAWIDLMPSTSSESERVFLTPTSLDSNGDTPSGKNSNSQRGKSSTGSGKSATSVLSHQEANVDTGPSPALKPEPSSVGYYALLFHTVRIMLYRPFLHNSTLAPVLPLTLQSPQSRCRESAVAISEIAENMVVEQRSYRQLFNSIHISLCAAATVHRFVIASPMTVNQQDKRLESMDVRNEPLATPGTPGATTSSSTPSTLSKAPSHSKTDLYYLTLILRILQNCCRFSIEKNLLRSIIDAYLPIRHLNPQDLVWVRYEINKPFTIVPFSIKMPLQTTAGARSVVAPSLSSSVASVQPQARHQQQQQQQHEDKEEDQGEGSSQQPQAQQYQQYQMQMRQHQNEQQQARQQARSRQLNDTTTANIAAPCTSQNLSLGAFTPGSPDDMTLHQGRCDSRASSIGSSTGYVATVAPGAYDGSTAEKQQLQQYQRELDLLQQHHRIQQSELNQHHQQQALQLEQAQLYQQQQQNQDYIQQNQQSSSMYIQQQHSGGGVLSPKTPYLDLPDHVNARNKRQSEASFKKKQAKQKQANGSQEQGRDRQLDLLQHQQQQQRHGPGRGSERSQNHERQHHQQRQEIQNYPQTDSYMADATPPDVDPGLALGSLSGLAGSDEMMTNNSAPSVVSHLTGTTDLSGTSGISSLDEFLGIESTGYYPDMPVTNTSDDYGNMDSTTLPLAGPAFTEGQDRTQLARSSNNSNIWYTDQQQPSTTGSSDSSNTNNNNNNNDGNGGSKNNNSSSDSNHQGRGSSHSQRSTVNESVGSGSLQFILANNDSDNNQGRFPGGSIMMVPGPMNVPSTWFGFDNINPGNTNQLPPLHPPRQGDSSAGYHYPYTLYAPQPPASHSPQAQSVPYVSYNAMGRPIGYTPPHPYVYTPENGAMGIYVPAPISQNPPAFNGAGLGWQPQPQLGPSQQLMLSQPTHQQQQQQQHQVHEQQVYSPHVSNQPLPVQQLQDPIQPYHYVGAQIHQPPTQLAPHQAHDRREREKQEQHTQPPLQHHQHHQQRQQQEQQQQQQQQQQQHRSPKLRLQGSPQSQQQQQQVRHPSATLLPPLPPFPQSIYSEESGVSRPFSPASSNATLVNPTSASNSGSSQMESNREDSSGRETSAGGESTSRSTSAQFESGRLSSSDSARMSRSMESSTGGSNESSSPSSIGDASNSNESGSSSENNGGSRSSSADPVAATTSAGVGVGNSGSSGDGNKNTGNNGNNGGGGGGSSGSGRRRRGKKSISPSVSGDSSTSSSNAIGSSSKTPASARHYRAHHQEQVDGSSGSRPRPPSSSSGSSGRSRSVSSGVDGGNSNGGSGNHESGGHRKHKNKYRSTSNEDSGSALDGSTAGSGIGSGSSSKASRRHGGGGRHRADSDSTGSGSGSGSNSGSSHVTSSSTEFSGADGGGGGGGNGNKNKSNRKGRGKDGKGKPGNYSAKNQQQSLSSVPTTLQQQR
ncbi:Transcriptional activator of fatty acid utilization [Mortierella sp. AD094]|nr:Transcriptional activator of fatty acid utilization [Mortierella sp. AD094]